jgi:hypothetical protein
MKLTISLMCKRIEFDLGTNHLDFFGLTYA